MGKSPVFSTKFQCTRCGTSGSRAGSVDPHLDQTHSSRLSTWFCRRSFRLSQADLRTCGVGVAKLFLTSRVFQFPLDTGHQASQEGFRGSDLNLHSQCYGQAVGFRG